MLETHAHRRGAPGWVVQADDKKKARLNCIHHLLSQMPYRATEHAPIELPERERHEDYVRLPVPTEIIIPEIY